jgi:hypothetical protein
MTNSSNGMTNAMSGGQLVEKSQQPAPMQAAVARITPANQPQAPAPSASSAR